MHKGASGSIQQPLVCLLRLLLLLVVLLALLCGRLLAFVLRLLVLLGCCCCCCAGCWGAAPSDCPLAQGLQLGGCAGMVEACVCRREGVIVGVSSGLSHPRAHPNAPASALRAWNRSLGTLSVATTAHSLWKMVSTSGTDGLLLPGCGWCHPPAASSCRASCRV